jgi:hypothetical protein
MFAIYDKAKPNTEHIWGLNSAVVKRTIIQLYSKVYNFPISLAVICEYNVVSLLEKVLKKHIKKTCFTKKVQRNNTLLLISFNSDKNLQNLLWTDEAQQAFLKLHLFSVR